MINIGSDLYNINFTEKDTINQRLIDNTCKTNLHPEFLFYQGYGGIISKNFVGNWTKTGFWISKFRHQFFQLRPDIIAKCEIYDDSEYKSFLKVKYSIGFSSLLIGPLVIFLFSLGFLVFNILVFFIAWIILTIGGYGLLAILEKENLQKDIEDKLLNNRFKKLGKPTYNPR